MTFFKINKLTLSNIRCYNDATFQFSDNRNVLVGTNGAGKSTIINSIGIGLFGKDYLNKMSLNTKDLIKWGENKGKINLEFSTEKGKYRSVFEISEKGKNSWKLYDLNTGKAKQITTKITETKEKIIELLDGYLDEVTFKNAVCSPQGMITNLLDLTPKERQKQIYQILGVEQFEKTFELTNKLIKKLENRKKTLVEKIETLESVIVPIDKLQKELDDLNEEFNKLSKMLPIKQKEAETLRKKIHSLEEKKSHYEKLLTQQRTIENDIETLNKEKASYEKSLESLKAETKINVSTINELNDISGKLNNEIKEMQKQKIGLTNEKQKYQETKKHIEDDEKSLNQNNKQLEMKKSQISELLQKAGTENIDELEEQIKQLDTKIALYNQEINEIKKSIEHLKTIKKQHEQTISKYNEKYGRLVKQFEEAFKTKIGMFDSVINQVQENISTLEKELDKSQKQRDSLKDEISAVNTEISQKRDVIKILNQSKTNAQNCPTCYQSLKNVDISSLISMHETDVNKLVAKKTKLDHTLMETNQLIQTKKQELDMMQKKMKSLEKIKQNLDELKNEKDELEHAKNELTIINKKINEKKQELQTKQKTNISDYEKEKTQLLKIKNHYRTIEKDIVSLKARISQLERQIKKNKDALSKINFQKIVQDLDILEMQLKNKQNLYRVLTSKYSQSLQNLENKKIALKEKSSKLKEIKKQLESIDPKEFNSEILSSLKRQQSDVDKAVGALTLKHDQLKNEQIPNKEKELKDAKTRMSEVNESKNRVKTIENAIDTYSLISQIIKEIPRTVLINITSSVSAQTTRLVQRFMPTHGFSSIKLNSDGSLQIVRNGHEIDLHSLSGGEKTVLALALRVALTTKVVPLNFMILDEPTQHLDRARIEEFIEIMDRGNIFGGINSQVILVTHVDEFKRVADQAIEITVGSHNQRTVLVQN